MAYELHLKADTIEGLAQAVQVHYEELSSILLGETLISGSVNVNNQIAQQNIASAASNLKAGDVVVLPNDSFVVASETTPDVTGQVDADGLPWDERIHSSSRKMTGKGVWTRRKNVAEAVYNEVVAELRGATHYGNSLSSLTAATSDELQKAAHAQGSDTHSEPVQFSPVPAPIAAPAPDAFLQSMSIPAAAPTALTINDLFVKMQQLFASNQADIAYIHSLNHRLSQRFQVQVSSINDIAGRPDMIAAAFEILAADGK